MSTLALPAPRERAAAFRVPVATLVVLGWTAIAIVLAELSTDAFVAWNTLGFAVIVARSFVRREGVDAGDVLPLFALYYALALLVRGIGLLTLGRQPLPGRDRRHALGALPRTARLVPALRGRWGSSPRRPATARARAIAGPSASPARLPSLSRPWPADRVRPVAAGLVLLGVLGAGMRVAQPGRLHARRGQPHGWPPR